MTTIRPQDAWNTKNIEAAEYFTAHFRKGSVEKFTVECKTLGQARKAAADLEKQHSKFGRKALVYAVTNKMTFHVPDDYKPEAV